MVTILFTDLSDSTEISTNLEPEQFAELLEQVRDVAYHVIPAHGGEIIRVDGDGMLCLFGFPEAHEDAGRRATEAALDMHAAMTSINIAFASPDRPLHLHSGIHAGLVLLRGGDIVRGKYEVLGDATNIAARICDAAGPGEILVSAQTLGGERHFFQTGEIRNVPLGRRKTPLRSFPVKGRAAALRRYDTRAIAGLTPFLGRTEECTTFISWLDGPQQENPVFCLSGPAGIGKSRLLHHLSHFAQERDWQVAHGYCEYYLSAQPLQPFRQAVDSIQALNKGNLETSRGDPAELETVLVASQKIMLVIDDWQWVDDASRDLLNRILLRTDTTTFRCILASREVDAEQIREMGAVSLALPPLDRDAAILAIEMLLTSPDPFAVDRIEHASGGSPLLIEELCHAFAQGLGAPDNDLRGAWFDQSVQARFDQLETQDQEFLKLSAVIGHMVPIWLIEFLLGLRLNTKQLARLQSADFLFPAESGDIYRFKHGLTRDALYAAIGLSERKALHGEVLAALEDAVTERTKEALLDGLAYHAIASGDAINGLPYAIAAGDAALAAGALDRAQAHYLAGIDVIPALTSDEAQRDAAWALINKYGLACIVDPAPDQLAVLERAETVLTANGPSRDAMRSAYWLGSIAYGVGLGKRSVAHLQSALDLAEIFGTGSDVQLIKIKLAHSYFASGCLGLAAKIFEAFLPNLKSVSSRNERELSSYAHAGYGFLNAERGNYLRSLELFHQAEIILADEGCAMNASILLYQSAALVSQGNWKAAIGAADAVLATSQRSRSRMQNRTCRAQSAYARWKLMKAPEAAVELEQVAREFIVPGHSRQHVSMVFGWTVEVMVELGAIDKARFFMGEVILRIREGGDRLGEAMAWRAMARNAQEIGNDRRADRYLMHARRSADARLSRSEAAHNLVCQAVLCITRAQVREADVLLESAAQEFDEMEMPWFHDSALRLTSRLSSQSRRLEEPVSSQHQATQP